MPTIPTSDVTDISHRAKRRYSADEKAELIKQWKSSGLSKAAFCRQEDIRESAFYAWTAPSVMKEQPKSTATQFNPVKLAADNQSVQLFSKASLPHSPLLQIELNNGIRASFPLPSDMDETIKLIKGLV